MAMILWQPVEGCGFCRK